MITNLIAPDWYKKICDYFNGDDKKVYLWFITPNPGLGYVTPLQMIKVGRTEKLNKFIDNSLEENFP